MKIHLKEIAKNNPSELSLKGFRSEVEAKLKSMANPDCKKCYGRGFIGFDRARLKLIPCKKCLRIPANEKHEQPRTNKPLSTLSGLDYTNV